MDGPATDKIKEKLGKLSFSQLAELERFVDFVLNRDEQVEPVPEPIRRPPNREPVLNRPREEVATPRSSPPRPYQGEATRPLDISSDGVRKAILEIFNEQCATLTSGLLISTLEGVWKRYRWPEEKLVDGVEALLEEGIFKTGKLDPPRFLLSRKGFELLQDQAPSTPPARRKPPQMAQPKVTEAHLRSAILGLYTRGQPKRGMAITTDELSRMWVDVKIRAEHLRIGLDMLEGQEYLRLVMEGGVRAFKLTEAGFIYVTGKPTAEGLMALSGEHVTEKNRPSRYPDGDALQRAVLDIFKTEHAEVGSKVGFSNLRLNWRPTGLRDDDLVRGLEFLLKEGMAELEIGGEPSFRLTQTGFKGMNAWSPLASLKKRLTVGQL